MKRMSAGLAALVMLAFGAAPLAAHAAAAAPEITKDQRDKGKKEAPAAVKAAGLSCVVSDAYYLGSSTGKDGKSDVYEVACQEGLGYMVMAKAGGAAKAYDCVATADQPTMACKLPGNANPAASLAPQLTAAGVTCTPKTARYIGASSTQSLYEVACQEGPGYVLQAPLVGAASPPPLTALPCAQTLGVANLECKLTTKDQSIAYVSALAAKSGRPCQVSNERFLGSSKSGDAFYEIACGASPGYVLTATKAGVYKSSLSCSQAASLGGCTMTDMTKVAAAEMADDSRRVKAAGFNCDVSKTRPIGKDASGGDVVELACANRPDGTVAVFPTSPTAPATVVDCVKSGMFGSSGACQLTSPAPVYAVYTSALAAKGRSSCKVSGARYLGHVPSTGSDFVETACVDGKPGWVLELSSNDKVKTLLSCGQAASMGMGCTLPTNQRH